MQTKKLTIEEAQKQAITKILPPISRFSKTGERTKKRETIIEKFIRFFEKYFDISKEI